jgi:hypothetical protein
VSNIRDVKANEKNLFGLTAARDAQRIASDDWVGDNSASLSKSNMLLSIR